MKAYAKPTSPPEFLTKMATNHDSHASDNESTASYESDNTIQLTFNTTKFKCDHCSRKFARLYTLRRHLKTMHDLEDTEDSDMSADENASNTESSDENTSDTSDVDCSFEDSNDKEENYPTFMFRQLVCQTINEHDDDLSALIDEMSTKNLSDREAMKCALVSSKDALKTLQRLYAQNMLHIIEHRRDPLYKAILRKAKELQDDGFSLSEAIKSAVSYRKNAIYNLVNFM